jgi:hypothetical protein
VVADLGVQKIARVVDDELDAGGAGRTGRLQADDERENQRDRKSGAGAAGNAPRGRRSRLARVVVPPGYVSLLPQEAAAAGCLVLLETSLRRARETDINGK